MAIGGDLASRAPAIEFAATARPFGIDAVHNLSSREDLRGHLRSGAYRSQRTGNVASDGQNFAGTDEKIERGGARGVAGAERDGLFAAFGGSPLSGPLGDCVACAFSRRLRRLESNPR